MPLSIKSVGIREIAANLDISQTEARAILDARMEHLGPIVVRMMQRQLAKHRVTGKLEGSVQYAYISHRRELRVGPTLKRGRYDAGRILQEGTGPIPNLPFTPIAKWAAKRGLPAGPVWMKIKQTGVKPHPFIRETALRPEFKRSLDAAARRTANDFVVRAIRGVMP